MISLTSCKTKKILVAKKYQFKCEQPNFVLCTFCPGLYPHNFKEKLQQGPVTCYYTSIKEGPGMSIMMAMEKMSMTMRPLSRQWYPTYEGLKSWVWVITFLLYGHVCMPPV